MEGLTQLATLLRERGLSTTTQEAVPSMEVANPISRSLREVVMCSSGRYLTAWGYEVGQAGDELSAADRLAFLLGVPSAGTK